MSVCLLYTPTHQIRNPQLAPFWSASLCVSHRTNERSCALFGLNHSLVRSIWVDDVHTYQIVQWFYTSHLPHLSSSQAAVLKKFLQLCKNNDAPSACPARLHLPKARRKTAFQGWLDENSEGVKDHNADARLHV